MTEEWRPVKGFEDLYQVSSEGRVMRIGAPAKRGHNTTGRLLKDHFHKGYRIVNFCRNARRSRHLLHRLIAFAFLPPPEEGVQCINHKDGDKKNNDIANLEWVTFSENLKHSYRSLGRKPRPAVKLTEAEVIAIRASSSSHRALGRLFGVSEHTIRNVRIRKIWRHLP